jgi:hypothetical protein
MLPPPYVRALCGDQPTMVIDISNVFLSFFPPYSLIEERLIKDLIRVRDKNERQWY